MGVTQAVELIPEAMSPSSVNAHVAQGSLFPVLPDGEGKTTAEYSTLIQFDTRLLFMCVTTSEGVLTTESNYASRVGKDRKMR